jgi:hypothetical protein
MKRVALPTALACLVSVASGCASVETTPAAPEAKAADPTVVAAAAAAAVAGNKAAGTPTGTASPSVAAAAGAAAGAAAAAAAASKPFADVIKEAKLTPGLFPLWRKDEKVWLELAPDQFNHPFLFTANLSRGLGEHGVYGGMMLFNQVVEFKRIGNNVQLIARNYAFTGGANAPVAQEVKEGFTDSLLGATTVASQPHPERKTILIDANALLLTDLPPADRFTYGVHARNYVFDAKNTSFDEVHNTADQTSLVVLAHYANAKATLPPPPTVGPPPPVFFPPFDNLPDGRSLFLGYTYNFATLPTPMPTRRADPRVGYFQTDIWDFSTDTKYTAQTHLANHWRLEKKDPDAALSEPKEPIVYWIDRNVPEAYRPAVRAGILEWNKAFEKIGFKDAIVVKQQDVDPGFETYDARHSTVRWFASTDAGFSIGPSVVDPRTGEILNAQVGIAEVWSRGDRTFITEQAPGAAGTQQLFDTFRGTRGLAADACTYSSEALAETEFGLDLLEARGDIAPGSPEADKFVMASLKAVVMHEVGHTLGLRHNFRASTAYSLAQISDPAFSSTTGLSASVMDYNPLNIAVKGERQGAYVDPTIGPYDYWAIEYGYKPLPAATQDAELAKIAAEGTTNRLLEFSTDEEVIAGLDPDASMFDLGDDPLAYLQKRVVNSEELWTRLQTQPLPPGTSYDVLRRSFLAGFRQVTRATALTAKYVGGVYYVRDYSGGSRLPLTPVPPAQQRAALKLLATQVFAADSFRFKPEFMRSLGINYLDFCNNPGCINPDFSLRQRVLGLQTAALGQLLSPTVMSRLLDSEIKVNKSDQALTIPELYTTLDNAVFSELRSGAAIPGPRRDLQNAYLEMLVGMLTQPPRAMPPDARALAREEAKRLSGEIKGSLGRGGRDAETRAHLAASANLLDEALKAPMLRANS